MKQDKSIFIKNIYYMLSYAFQTLRPEEYDDVETEDFDNIHNLFAAVLSKGIGKQLKRGLYREYVAHNEDLTALRGKIDMQGTIRRRLARSRELSCEYDELSENNLLNQILKTTSMILLRHGEVSTRYGDELKKRMLFFSDVDLIEPGEIQWSGIRFSRNNQSYRMLVSLCQLIMDGMLLTTDKGEHKLMSFLDDQNMSRLYEKFILEYFKKSCPFVKASSPQIKWALDDGIGTLLPTMQTDIVLSRGDTVLIVDAKYYTHTMQERYETRRIHSDNLYQIFTYVKNKEVELAGGPHEVSGMLLYARTDEALQPDATFQMSGNQISVRTLDLNQEFMQIAEQLDAVARDHFGVETVEDARPPEIYLRS